MFHSVRARLTLWYTAILAVVLVTFSIISYALPARYYVTLLQTVFLAGDIWGVILPNAVVLLGMAAGLLALTRAVATKKLS